MSEGAKGPRSVGSETVEVLRYEHRVVDTETHNAIPRNRKPSIKLLVKRIEHHSEQPMTEDGWKYSQTTYYQDDGG